MAIVPSDVTIRSIENAFDFVPSGIPEAGPEGDFREASVEITAETFCLQCHTEAKVVRRLERDAMLAAKREPRHSNDWFTSKASPVERLVFLPEIGTATPGATVVTTAVTAGPFAVDRRLERESIALVRDVMTSRNMAMGDVAHELGRKRLNVSLRMAFSQGSRLEQDLIDDLEVWLGKQVIRVTRSQIDLRWASIFNDLLRCSFRILGPPTAI